MRGASRSRLLEEGELGLAQRGGATRLRRSLNLIFFVAVCAIAAPLLLFSFSLAHS